MSTLSPVTGETSDTKVAAIFDDEGSARRIAATLRRELRLRQSQVQVLSTGDSDPNPKMDLESRGLVRTMLTKHAKHGLVGASYGAVVYALMYASGLCMVHLSHRFAYAVIITDCADFSQKE